MHGMAALPISPINKQYRKTCAVLYILLPGRLAKPDRWQGYLGLFHKAVTVDRIMARRAKIAGIVN
jgi:hypothetical protein